MKRVTSSSTMAEAGKEAIFLRNLFSNLDVNSLDVKSITCYYDNQPGYNQIKGEGITQKSKHYDVPLFLLREYIQDGFLKLSWKSGVENSADSFTKALSPVLFSKFTYQLNMANLISDK